MSAVMDGRATPADWARVNAAWDRDPALRERWALWHAAGDGLRSADLPDLHRPPQALLEALHAQLPADPGKLSRHRDWFAPLAVAAGFVVVAIGVGTWRPPAAPPALVAAAPIATPRAQGLTGMSFAQAAAGRTLPAWSGSEAASESIDWGLALPEPAASQSRP
jgi:negative regulator of sigma E activity